MYFLYCMYYRYYIYYISFAGQAADQNEVEANMKPQLRIMAGMAAIALTTAPLFSPSLRGAALLLAVFAAQLWLLGLPRRMMRKA